MSYLIDPGGEPLAKLTEKVSELCQERDKALARVSKLESDLAILRAKADMALEGLYITQSKMDKAISERDEARAEVIGLQSLLRVVLDGHDIDVRLDEIRAALDITPASTPGPERTCAACTGSALYCIRDTQVTMYPDDMTPVAPWDTCDNWESRDRQGGDR